jgi:hypothetical protein
LALRGLSNADVLYVRAGKHALGLASSAGSLYLLDVPASAILSSGRYVIYHGRAESPGGGVWGFRYSGGRGMLGARFVAVPLALPALICALIAVWLMRRGCRRPMNPALCRVCGYDLRASPQRCPECGTAVAAGETSQVKRPAIDG